MEIDIHKIFIIAFLTATVKGNEFLTLSRISQDMENILHSVESPTVTYCHMLCSQENNCDNIGVTKDSAKNSLYNCYLLKRRNETLKDGSNEDKKVDGCQKGKNVTNPGPTITCSDNLAKGVPKEMVGKWDLSYTNGWQMEYSITSDGSVTSGANTLKLERSDNQDKYPSKECWFLLKKTQRPWEYIRLGADGVLDIYTVCKDGDGCKRNLKPGKWPFCCVAMGRKEGGSPHEMNRVKIPKEMAGKWILKFNGLQISYPISITSDGFVTIGKMTQSFRQSDNQDKFPSSKGWFLWKNFHRAEAWEYVRLGKNGLLEIQHFCSDSDDCRKFLDGMAHYCCSVTGRR